MGQIKEKMLRWASRYNIFSFLDNQQYLVDPHRFECLLAAGVQECCSSADLCAIDAFLEREPAWIFGHLGYELKNAIQDSGPFKTDRIGFGQVFFFKPLVLVQLRAKQLYIQANDPVKIYEEILSQPVGESFLPAQHLKQRLTREEYIGKIRKLQQHIIRGDCYEVNFCQEFYADEAVVDPINLYSELARLSPNPFSALYRFNDSYLVCASPERFLVKEGSTLFAQPMKGTIKRNREDDAADNVLRDALKNSSKDKSENVMVVDMVRNDLTKICKPGTVKVDELFGVYAYPNVHQMISTISGSLDPGTRFSDIVRATFPMGSMTGAPKHRVMELIDQYEEGPRGIYSGSIGYFDPTGNFDFNVVIRSIMYNAKERYLSFQLGSGITFYSDPQQEWEECLLKGEAIKKVLTGGQH